MPHTLYHLCLALARSRCNFCVAVLHQRELALFDCYSERSKSYSGGDTTAPCIFKYYISFNPVGNITETSLVVLFVSSFFFIYKPPFTPLTCSTYPLVELFLPTLHVAVFTLEM